MIPPKLLGKVGACCLVAHHTTPAIGTTQTTSSSRRLVRWDTGDSLRWSVPRDSWMRGGRWVDAGRRAVAKPMPVALARRRVASSAAQRAPRAARSWNRASISRALRLEAGLDRLELVVGQVADGEEMRADHLGARRLVADLASLRLRGRRGELDVSAAGGGHDVESVGLSLVLDGLDALALQAAERRVAWVESGGLDAGRRRGGRSRFVAAADGRAAAAAAEREQGKEQRQCCQGGTARPHP